MSSAANIHSTEAVKRTGVSPANAKLEDVQPVQKYSSRQQGQYDQDKLFQYKVPELSMQDLLSSIPKHCFERSTLWSSLYLALDFVQVAGLIYAATWINPVSTHVHFSNSYVSEETVQSAVRFVLWTLYSFYQGLVFTGIWVIAHECGHQAFSPSKTINNSVGWVLHSALLVPYHSWRISHARHHAGTGHMTRDEVFVPRTRKDRGLPELCPADQPKESATSEETFGEWLAETLEDVPLYNFVELIIQQLVGWPLYLMLNVSGQQRFPKWTNLIFDKRHRNQVLVSDLGIALSIASLIAWGTFSPGGWGQVAKYYLVPYLWTNNWLVMITYLQHTDPMLPHYDASMWNFARGALCTMDRNWLGPVGPYLLHGISETHVLHHVCSKIPHYHAWEASEALQKRVGQHYMKSNENVLVSLWKTMRGCRFVKEEPVAFYHNVHGVPKSTAVLPQSEDSGVALSN
ncbi:hypothetical protein MYAM1_001579 [Malassezia yamatoensis]|uniref:Fatty acid desaturase domain-containing protein n=1 Tax=Malassezia yamatoensis TaxID=253288 RepID=A0AAJ6CIG9_9BASI|nr:hypothetical protein MYAM1_001579 [Malassezia yamatoensis]